ncbi:MAG: 23S rRNA (pseudouridine(1915)-N(3))-methyltransferase RlmH [Candidatus Aphodosoma sp.]
MKIAIVWIGKTAVGYMQEAVADYAGRIRHYMPFELVDVPDVRGVAKGDADALRIAEGQAVLRQLKPDDYVVLLDDKGRQYTSPQLAAEIERLSLSSARRVVYVIGGAFGFSLELYNRADALLSLSKMTFSHQMVRAVFLEQIYRAMTILRGEPYHHDESLFSLSLEAKRKR